MHSKPSISPGAGKRPDASEALAKKFLSHVGRKEIVYEPRGRDTPPDFLVDGRIAVEVRRLNKNFAIGSKFEGIEEGSWPRITALEKLLCSLGPPTHGASWFVSCRFSRSDARSKKHWQEHWRKLKPEVRAALKGFINGPKHDNATLAFGTGYELKIQRAGNLHPTFFVLGGFTDKESGGWVVDEIERNLRICIEEKTKDITNLRLMYSECWLVFADHIGYGHARDLFDEPTCLSHSWDEIILVNPLDHTCWFTLDARHKLVQSARSTTNASL